MKRVRMILGEYEQPEPYALDFFVCPVELPMEVERLNEDGIPTGADKGLVTLTTEAELEEWAGMRFAAYEIFDMHVADTAIREGRT